MMMKPSMQRRITPNLAVKWGCEMNNKSMQEDALSNIHSASFVF